MLNSCCVLQVFDVCGSVDQLVLWLRSARRIHSSPPFSTLPSKPCNVRRIKPLPFFKPSSANLLNLHLILIKNLGHMRLWMTFSFYRLTTSSKGRLLTDHSPQESPSLLWLVSLLIQDGGVNGSFTLCFFCLRMFQTSRYFSFMKCVLLWCPDRRICIFE